MGHWTSKADYTNIDFRGTVPRSVVLTSEGIQIQPKSTEQSKQAESPNMKEAGAVIPASILVEEIQQVAKDHRQEFLPVKNVIAIIRNTMQFVLRSWIENDSADVKHWPDPPHVEFTNCTFDDPEDVKRFIEEYGFGAGMIHEPPAKWITLGMAESRFDQDYGFDSKKLHHQPPKTLEITVERLKQDQVFLRRFWGRTAQAQPTLKQHFLWSPDDINFINGKPKIVISDIWDYILVLFLIDLSKGRLRVCANPSCRRLKYFVQERPDQKYCSTYCKNSVGSSRYLADKSKRDKWNGARRKGAKAKKPYKAVSRGRRHP